MHAQEHILFEQVLFYRFKKVRKRKMYALGIALMKNGRQKRIKKLNFSGQAWYSIGNEAQRRS